MEAIAIIDFGGQYAHLIGNRIRRLGVYSDVLLPETPMQKIAKYKGIILSGGPQSVYANGAPTIDKKIFSLGIPVLGLCYGHQLLAYLLGGKVESGKTKEYGLASLSVKRKIGIFEGVRDHTQIWMSHGDTVTKLPKGFEQYGKTPDCEFAAMGSAAKKIFGAQFHMEVTHTTEGMKMLENFLNLCRVKREWNTEKFLARKIQEMKKFLGDRKVFLLVSGGVDSTVAYALLCKAIGADRVYGLFVDTGLLRKNEGRNVETALKKIGVKNFHVVSAKSKFLATLKGKTAPEDKRKIIGDMFLQVQAEVVRKLRLNPEHWVLGQGTIYPDTIESAGTKHADKIKTHHNRVPEILELIKKGRVIEPLAELYKDEVRHLGERLGLPKEIVWRHPFPGPGLAVRMLCVTKNEANAELDFSTEERAINEFLDPHGLTGKILPIQSVGVQGDARTYRHPLAIWSVKDSRAAEKTRRAPKHTPNFDSFERIATALTNRFSVINRVCLMSTPEKCITAKAISATITEKRVKLLQELDDIVMVFIKKNNMDRAIWQFPTVLIPVSVNGLKRESVVLRPVCSDEAMTANFYKMSPALLKKLTAKLVPHVSSVLYDITSKPPGTIEWE